MLKVLPTRLAILMILATALLPGCAARVPVPIELRSHPPCNAASGVDWAGPEAREDRKQLSDWCLAVGPLVVNAPDLHTVDVAESSLIVVTWNIREGYGDLAKFLRPLVSRSPVVALVQEVARVSDSVPLDIPTTVRVPPRIGPPQQNIRDVESIAAELNMSLAYLPSMPNGLRTHEDRGCAILSTLPMSDVMGIELPWVSQRRVAVMATVMAMNKGMPWHLRVVSMHLDNRLRRSQQAAAVADFLERHASSALPTIIGGDLNAWLGVRDRAVQEIDRVVPRIHECGDEGTFRFGGLRLDHLFTTLPKASHKSCFVESDNHGSDHYPIVFYFAVR